MEKCGRAGMVTGDNITRRMRFACWLPKVTNTHSEYVILTVFPRRQWLNKRASLLRHSTFRVLILPVTGDGKETFSNIPPLELTRSMFLVAQLRM